MVKGYSSSEIGVEDELDGNVTEDANERPSRIPKCATEVEVGGG